MTDPIPDTGPLVSVVVPTYERPELLCGAVRSVAAQTYEPIELLVVDDHSRTPVRSAVAGLDLDGPTRVRHVRHPENRGVSAARNTGIRAAEGDYVAFLDDDDRWEERKIRAQVDAFADADGSTGVVYTGVEFTDGEESVVHRPRLRGDVTRALLTGEPLAPTSTVMVRRELLHAAGLFDEKLPTWNDRDLYLRLSTRCAFEPVPEPLTTRRSDHGREQISRDYGTKRDVTFPRFLAKHRPLAANHGRLVERRFLAATTLMLAKAALMNGFYREARHHFVRSIRWYPLDPEPYLHLLTVLAGGHSYRAAERARGLVAGVVATLRGLAGGDQR